MKNLIGSLASSVVVGKQRSYSLYPTKVSISILNNAEMGIYVVLHKPSKGMVADAKEKGAYHSEEWNKDFPKVQIYEMKNLFDGIKPLIPPPYLKKGKGVLLDI